MTKDQLTVDDIVKEFPARNEPLRVLSGISLRLSKGDSLAVSGPSGSGKSTLLHILGTLERPTSGSVKLNGQDPFSLKEPELADFRNQHIGFVFQDHHLLGQCTVLENVLIPATAQGHQDRTVVERGRELLSLVGLDDRSDDRPSELSGGQRQRVALARALLLQPDLVLADEPTGNLDRTTATSVAELMLELQRSQQTILVVATHSQHLAELMQRQLELDDGQLRPA